VVVEQKDTDWHGTMVPDGRPLWSFCGAMGPASGLTTDAGGEHRA